MSSNPHRKMMRMYLELALEQAELANGGKLFEGDPLLGKKPRFKPSFEEENNAILRKIVRYEGGMDRYVRIMNHYPDEETLDPAVERLHTALVGLGKTRAAIDALSSAEKSRAMQDFLWGASLFSRFSRFVKRVSNGLRPHPVHVKSQVPAE